MTIDSSIFQRFTPDDPALPRNLVVDSKGQDRFQKYLPFKSFVNTIDNSPYPYIINRLCWEFPCVVPSDWEAQNIQKANNPLTVEDMKAALDATVAKQGVFNLVFHPHGWIKNEQVVELIDHAVKSHGSKIKFLNFREAQERLNTHLLAGATVRAKDGSDNGVRVLDLNNDGLSDVVIGNGTTRKTRIWIPESKTWKTSDFPTSIVGAETHFGFVTDPVHPALILSRNGEIEGFQFDGANWKSAPELVKLPEVHPDFDRGFRLRDLDRDGLCELLIASPGGSGVYQWSKQGTGWKELPFRFPEHTKLAYMNGDDAGLRFIDINEDGFDDLFFSNDEEFGLSLFTTMKDGWSRKVLLGRPGDPDAIPKIVSGGTDRGAFVHSRHVWWQNEETAKLPDLVDRRSFNDLLKTVEPGAKSPRASRDSIEVRPGFKVELAAEEPLVEDPIAFDWSADGRLWVVEMGDYPLGVDGKGRQGGVVRVLVDDDHDGHYDRSTVFLDGLPFPTGLIPWRNGVIVSAAPEIFFAEDRDGDGRADHREVLFDGFEAGNQQHRLNGFEVGLDGWVYGANGDSGGKIRSLKTGKVVDIRGRDFRFQPEDGRFETENGLTQYGRHRDDWGRAFGNNNSIWAWVYMFSEADLKRNPLYSPPDPRRILSSDGKLFPISRTVARFNDPGAANHVTSANSATPYRDDLFGPAFSDTLFVSEPVHNLVHRLDLKADGPSLIGERAEGETGREFLASSDHWFRPTMLKTGPDGALWIADMYRAVIEHPEWIPDDWEARLDLRAGHDQGRIYRVLPVDRTARPFVALNTLDTAGLVKALESPNGWTRDTVHRLLLHKNDRAAIEPLRTLVRSTPLPKTKVQALWILENLGGLDEGVVLSGLYDPHPKVRQTAIRLGEELFETSPKIAEAILKNVTNPDQAIRFQLALSFGNIRHKRAGEALAQLCRRDDLDDWTRAAILTSSKAHIGTLLSILFEDLAKPPDPAIVEPLFRLAGALADRQPLIPLIRAVSRPNVESGEFAVWQFSAMAGLLDLAQRSGKTLEEWADSDDLKAAIEGLQPLWNASRLVAVDETKDDEQRIVALMLVGRSVKEESPDRELLANLLHPRVSGAVQAAALSAIGRGSDPKLPEVLLASRQSVPPSLWSAILDTLLTRDAWTASLLSSLEDRCTPRSEIGPIPRRRMLLHTNLELKKRAEAVFGSEVATDRAAIVMTFRGAMGHPGDSRVGSVLFKKLCAACHKIGEVGAEVGPDLAMLADKSDEAMLTAILDPNRAFESKFSGYSVGLKDGRVLTGLIASESATALTLRGQEGKDEVILRADIEALRSLGQSFMPEGLEKDLKPEDLANMLAFLRGVRPAPKALLGNAPGVVRPGDDGRLVLNAARAEIFGDTLVFEPTYENLGYFSSSNDWAAWQFEGMKPGRYEVWVESACDPASAGQSMTVQVGSAMIEYQIPATKDWSVYLDQRAGEVEIGQSEGRLVIRPSEPLRGALGDIRSIALRHIK